MRRGHQGNRRARGRAASPRPQRIHRRAAEQCPGRQPMLQLERPTFGRPLTLLPSPSSSLPGSHFLLLPSPSAQQLPPPSYVLPSALFIKYPPQRPCVAMGRPSPQDCSLLSLTGSVRAPNNLTGLSVEPTSQISETTCGHSPVLLLGQDPHPPSTPASKLCPCSALPLDGRSHLLQENFLGPSIAPVDFPLGPVSLEACPALWPYTIPAQLPL